MKLTLYFLLFLCASCIKIEFGHHFSFTNKSGYDIDSLAITVGSETTMVKNSDYGMSENLAVPEKGYPHKVKIQIYTAGKKNDLIADSFNCYNCDGSHQYILTKDSAHYVFHN